MKGITLLLSAIILILTIPVVDKVLVETLSEEEVAETVRWAKGPSGLLFSGGVKAVKLHRLSKSEFVAFVLPEDRNKEPRCFDVFVDDDIFIWSLRNTETCGINNVGWFARP